MVKHRKPVSFQHKHGNNNETSSSSSGSESSTVKRFSVLSMWKTIVGVICLVIAVYVSMLGYLETRVNTPFDGDKAVQATGLDVPDRYWGSYRPGVYFGMKAREPKSPVFGLMWYEMDVEAHKGIRHLCSEDDRMATYGWLRHDGVTFGEQRIVDPPHVIYTSFVKTPGGSHGGQWTARVNITGVDPKLKALFVLIWYAALDEVSPGASSSLRYQGEMIRGHTPQLSNFRVQFVPHKAQSVNGKWITVESEGVSYLVTSKHTGKLLHTSYSEAHVTGLNLLKEKYFSLLTVRDFDGFGKMAVMGPDTETKEGKEVNFVPVQMLVETPFVMDIVYSPEDVPAPPLRGLEYSKVLEDKKRAFDQRFEETFRLVERGYPEDEVSIARAALSNMVGGIGYFYGTSRVQSQYTSEPVPYWKAALYSGVPSRSFFPRGFLWDEGFHGLLIGRWSLDIQLDIAAHWLDLLNVEGWIPREQILGAEALARVPKEFVVQSNAAANPPMLALTLARLVRNDTALSDSQRARLGRLFNRLQAWYQWFQNTQKGEEPTSYRWRGREDDGVQLNPKTLTSGLDDYPRASHPSEIERHVDLRCWMYAAADAMATIAQVLGRDTDKFEMTRDQLGDENLLNELHWSPHTQTYADYGLHTDGVRLVRNHPQNPSEPSKVVRSVTTPPQPKLVTSAFGYVSLFPMLLKVLHPSSDKLGKILEDLDKPDLLWSPFGLRSLSKSAPLYMKRNTEHDPPYWRGQVWINVNYLALAALKHYADAGGPHAERAAQLHLQLRENVVGNIILEYKRTGYLWEQYSGEDGRGSGSRPFTGWTALVVLIMTDEY